MRIFHECSATMNCSRSSGFSLVELMIALLIGLLIVLGAGQLFITSKQSYNQMDGLAKRQQSLRAVADFVMLDVRTATDIPDNSGNESALILNYSTGVRDDDPYCGGSSELNSIEYEFLQDNNALYVTATCGGSVGSREELVDGIESMEFLQPISSDPAYGMFVWVAVTFDSMVADEPGERKSYKFMAARRKSIL